MTEARSEKLAGCLQLWALGLGLVGVIAGIFLYAFGAELEGLEDAWWLLVSLLIASVVSYVAAGGLEKSAPWRTLALVLAGTFSIWILPVGPIVAFLVFRYMMKEFRTAAEEAAPSRKGPPNHAN